MVCYVAPVIVRFLLSFYSIFWGPEDGLHRGFGGLRRGKSVSRLIGPRLSGMSLGFRRPCDLEVWAVLGCWAQVM